jgi:hypothetical protein
MEQVGTRMCARHGFKSPDHLAAFALVLVESEGALSERGEVKRLSSSAWTPAHRAVGFPASARSIPPPNASCASSSTRGSAPSASRKCSPVEAPAAPGTMYLVHRSRKLAITRHCAAEARWRASTSSLIPAPDRHPKKATAPRLHPGPRVAKRRRLGVLGGYGRSLALCAG